MFDSSVTEEDLCEVGISWWYLQMTWVNLGGLGPESNSSSPLAQASWSQIARVNYFTCPPCQGILLFPEYWGERPKPTSCPLSLGGVKGWFPSRLALPHCAPFYRLCQDFLFFAPSGSAAFHPWAVTSLPHPGSHPCTVLELGTGSQRNPACKKALIGSAVTLATALCCNPSCVTGSVPETLQSLMWWCLRSVFKVSVLV